MHSLTVEPTRSFLHSPTTSTPTVYIFLLHFVLTLFHNDAIFLLLGLGLSNLLQELEKLLGEGEAGVGHDDGRVIVEGATREVMAGQGRVKEDGSREIKSRSSFSDSEKALLCR